MNLAQIFETLLSDRKITLVLPDRKAADSLRVSLLRKFKDYKTQMTDLGFLDPELEPCVVSLEWKPGSGESQGRGSFFLREKIRKQVEYTIVTDTTEGLS